MRRQDPEALMRGIEYDLYRKQREEKKRKTTTKSGKNWRYEYDTSVFGRALLVVHFDIRAERFLVKHKGFLLLSKLEREVFPRRVIAEKWREVRRQARDYRAMTDTIMDYTPSDDLDSPVEGR